MDSTRLRGWWAARQGLDRIHSTWSPATVLAHTGWSRSLAGAGPYLTLFSRAGVTRAAADLAVAKQLIRELPAARGCTYVVPADEYPLALAVGAEFGGQDLKQALKLGVTEREIDRLAAAVTKAVTGEVLDPEAIRVRVGTAVRSLGEAGKKKGLSTTLPLALGRLQTTGVIRRIPTNGRLDQQRYHYVLWDTNPLAGWTFGPEETFQRLATRFFQWAGPATAAEFQTFSGLGVKRARAAIEALGLVPIEPGSDRLLSPEDLPRFRSFTPPPDPRYTLVSSLDPITTNRGNVDALLDPADAGRALAKGGVPHHAILDRGRIIGWWEFDPGLQRIVWASFVGRNRALNEAVATTERFVREQLEDARTFSLDSPKSRAPRIAALEALAK